MSIPRFCDNILIMEITQTKTAVFRLKTKVASVILDGKVTIESKKDPFVINEPGEYEVEGVSVFGFGVGEQKVIYLIQAEGLRVLYMANIDKELTEAQIEELGTVDTIILPVGTIEAKVMVKMVEAIEPTYVVPFEAGLAVSNFVTSYERGSREAKSLPLSLATMPQDLTEVVVLSI